MNPAYLYNEVFWAEPQNVDDQFPPEEINFNQYMEHKRETFDYNQQYFNNFNGEGPSTAPSNRKYPRTVITQRYEPY